VHPPHERIAGKGIPDNIETRYEENHRTLTRLLRVAALQVHIPTKEEETQTGHWHMVYLIDLLL
jgi:hypothetical protein